MIEPSERDLPGWRGIGYRRPPVRRPASHRLLAALFGALLLTPALGCRPSAPVAPSWEGAAGAPISEKDLPLAATHYVFSRPGTPGRTELARPLADRLLQRAGASFASGREQSALAAMRLAAMLVRANKAAPEGLSDPAVAVFERAVVGPGARGEEGVAIGMYLFWSVARPADPRPKAHLDALAKWTGSPADFPPSALVTIGREALRRSEALAYAPNDADRPAADKALVDWMDEVVAFKDGQRTPARYGDEVYAAVLGYRTSGVRLVANHLRDGDVNGAIDAIGAPQTESFVPDAIRRALLDAGATPSAEGYEQIIAAMLPAAKLEGLDAAVSDAVLGTALAGIADHQSSTVLAEVAARGLLMAGSGDAAPAILARALLGTRDDPRRPPAKDLGRALAVTSAAILDYADRDDYDAARRTFASAEPLIVAAERIGGVSPSPAMLKTRMGKVEGEAGKPAVARKLFDDAIAAEPLATALAGRARLEAREGNLAAARASIAKALSSGGIEGEPALEADLRILAGDYARLAGDAAAARTEYERGLKLLASLGKQAKGASAAEVFARVVTVLVRFEGAAEREDDAAALAETAGGDARAVSRVIFTRFLRALRTVDVSRAKALFRRAGEVGLSQEEQVRAAILARAILKRAGRPDDSDVSRALTQAAAKDDAAGRLARVALGQLDVATATAKAGSPRRELDLRFAAAISKWGASGLAAAKPDLEAIASADVVGAMQSELAREVLDPSKGVLPGAPAVTGP